MYHLYRRTCGWILRYAYRTLWREYVDWGCSGPGCIYGNVWCGSNFQGIFVIIREKKIWILRIVKKGVKYVRSRNQGTRFWAVWPRWKIDDGLKEVNSFLEQGWKVKMISACSMGDAITSGQAYIVLEKE